MLERTRERRGRKGEIKKINDRDEREIGREKKRRDNKEDSLLATDCNKTFFTIADF